MTALAEVLGLERTEPLAAIAASLAVGGERDWAVPQQREIGRCWRAASRPRA